MNPTPLRPTQRRQFLKLLGLSGLSILLARCGIKPAPTAAPLPTATAAPSATPSPAPSPTAVATATATIAPSATPTYASRAAIGQANDYEPRRLRQELERMLDDLGGLGDLIKPGARVGIKPNLTGGTWTDPTLPVPATELFVTHPALIGALAELLIDAGAGSITIMDGLGDPLIFPRWGYQEMAKPLGANLLDLCLPKPYDDFAVFPVGEQRAIYDVFYMNAAMKELDVFISVAKLKCHTTTGVTLSLKNLIGIAPTSLYRDQPEHNNRSSFHESTVFDTRLPRVAIDLNLARPVHLAIIDGIFTAEGGAGPWDKGLSQVKPGLLVASKDPVAADAVATALMGFDPSAPSKTHPFTHAYNHLALASAVGLGTHQLAEIGIHGPAIRDVTFPFKPAN
jgi:uncharacterized protein (DUF362 family)